ESSIRTLYGEYARARAAPNVANYVEGQLKYFQNAKMDRILELTRLFNPKWESELKVACEGEFKDAVDSIVTNKNRIAHGESVGITIVVIRGYYDRAWRVLEMIDAQCAG